MRFLPVVDKVFSGIVLDMDDIPYLLCCFLLISAVWYILVFHAVKFLHV